VRVHLCGVRGSSPAPGLEFVRYGGNTACIALARDGDPQPTLILDAGGGLQRASSLLEGEPFDGTILLSHLHWDHVLGLPFFATGDNLNARVSLLLPEQESGASAETVLAGMMSPPYFPIEPHQLRGEWTFATIAPGALEVEGFEVLAREVPHKGGRTFGYRVSDGHATLAYLPDHCPMLLGPGEDGWGAYHSAAIELARDVDVLVHDSALWVQELATEASYGHSLPDYAVGLGRRARAHSVVLFHHRHDRSDDELDALARRLGSDGSDDSPRVSVAAEGVTIEL
jgi:ribonuclease BN (tRNA processing enzyme)